MCDVVQVGLPRYGKVTSAFRVENNWDFLLAEVVLPAERVSEDWDVRMALPSPVNCAELFASLGDQTAVAEVKSCLASRTGATHNLKPTPT